MSEMQPNRKIAGVHIEHTDNRVVLELIYPNHPDFPAAVEALRALVPEPFAWEPGESCSRRRCANGQVEYRDKLTGVWVPVGHVETNAFEAGRRYERERGHADE